MKISKPLVLLFVAFLGIALLVHYPMLRFGLTSDHLQAIYEWRGRFINPSIASFKAFINPYGASAVLAKTIDWIWGINPFPYFFIALLTKVISAVGVFYFSKYLFKSTFIALIVGVAALTLFAGIQSAVPGATLYLSLFLMCIGFLRLFQLYELKQHKPSYRQSLIAVAYLLASFVVTPTRMYGIFPMFLIAEICALLLKKTTLKFVVIRTIILVVLFLLLKQIGLVDSYGTASGVATNVTSLSFYEKFPNLPGQLLFMFSAFRQVFIPDAISHLLIQLGLGHNVQAMQGYLVALLFGFPFFLFLRRITQNNRIIPYVFLGIYVLSIILSIYTLGTVTSLAKVDIFLGSFIANLLVCLLLYLWRSKSSLLIVSATFFGSPFIFMAVAYLLYPFQDQETLSRYFGASSFCAAIVIGIILSVSKKLHHKAFISLVALLFVSLLWNSILIQRYYRSAGEDGTYQHYLTAIFKIMNTEIGNRYGKSRPLVYVEGDSPNFLSTTITNQGHLRFSLENDSLSENSQPVFVTSLEKLVAIYTDKAKEPYPNITDINAVYGFKIENKKIYSTTSSIREYLLKATHSQTSE